MYVHILHELSYNRRKTQASLDLVSRAQTPGAAGMLHSDAAACVVYAPGRRSCLHVPWRRIGPSLRFAMDFDHEQQTFLAISSEKIAALLDHCAFDKSRGSVGE